LLFYHQKSEREKKQKEKRGAKRHEQAHDSNILIECELLSCPEPTLLYNCIKSNDGFSGRRRHTRDGLIKSNTFILEKHTMMDGCAFLLPLLFHPFRSLLRFFEEIFENKNK
jgi:hypothetical protein